MFITVSPINLSTALMRTTPRGLMRVPARPILDDELVAGLGSRQLQEMTVDELIRVIRTGALNFLAPSLANSLHLHERRTLNRLAHLACRACRNRISERARCWSGLDTPGPATEVSNQRPVSQRRGLRT